MKIIIPAAGEGTRLRPHTITKPKPILPVAGKTIIDFIMDEISQINGVDEIIFIVGYLKENIMKHLKENYKNFRLTFIEQKEYKGLAHAVSLAKSHIEENEPILIILGDTIFKSDLDSIVNRKENSLGVCEVENPSRFGVAVVNKNGIIERLVEKPNEPISNLALTGLYNIVDSKKLFESIEYIIKNDIKTKNEYQLTDALEHMIKEGIDFKTFKLEGWYDCGEKRTMLETNKAIMKHKIVSKSINDTAIIPPVFIAEGAVIEKSVIGPYVHIGKNTKITYGILKDCIVFENVNISNALMEDCMISENATYSGKNNKLDLGGSATLIEK